MNRLDGHPVTTASGRAWTVDQARLEVVQEPLPGRSQHPIAHPQCQLGPVRNACSPPPPRNRQQWPAASALAPPPGSPLLG